jgi:hypothetical protein
MAVKIILTDDEKEAVGILANARGYQLVTALLDNLTGALKKLVHYQMLASEVFALELSIKALLKLRGIKATGHDINALYGKLNQSDKDAIIKHYEPMINNHPSRQWALDLGIQLDINSVLQNNRDMFVKARYWHEGKLAAAPNKETASNAGVRIISEAISKVIRDKYPEWTDENLAEAFRPEDENSEPTT